MQLLSYSSKITIMMLKIEDLSETSGYTSLIIIFFIYRVHSYGFYQKLNHINSESNSLM